MLWAVAAGCAPAPPATPAQPAAEAAPASAPASASAPAALASLPEGARCRPIAEEDYPPVVADWRPPCDAAGTVVTASGIQYAFDVYAWRSFLAHSWPLDAEGEIDRARKPGQGPDGPVAWERWMPTAELFPKDPTKAPPKWGARPRLPKSCVDLGAPPDRHRRLLEYTHKVDMDPDTHGAGFPTLDDMVFDRNSHPVFYEVLLDQKAYDYLIEAGLTTTGGQEAFVKAGRQVSFPIGCNADPERGAGSTVVKASWIHMAPPYDAEDFHTSEVFLLDPRTKRCRVATMGLVGLHIATRSMQAPSWSWATFEHRANAPDVTEAAITEAYTFLDPAQVDASCYDVPRGAGCGWNEPPQDKPTGQKTSPTQIARELPFNDAASHPRTGLTVNAQSWALLDRIARDNVWANYALVGTQWACPAGTYGLVPGCPNGGAVTPPPVEGDSGCDLPPVMDTPTPATLANTTIETYDQLGSSCMGCHSAAVLEAKGAGGEPVSADFMFFLDHPR